MEQNNQKLKLHLNALKSSRTLKPKDFEVMSRLRCKPSVVLKMLLYRFALLSVRSFILHPSISKVFLSRILSFLLCRWFIPFLLCFRFCVISSFKIFFYEPSAIRVLHRYHASPLLFTRSRSDTLLAAGTTD